MFEAGALIYRIQTMGGEVFEKELAANDATLTKVGNTAKNTGKATEELGAKQDGTAKKTKDATKATEELGKSQSETKKKTDESTKATEQNGKALGGMSEEAKRASREVGQAAVGIGASFIAVAALSAKAAMDWESAWTGVTKTVDADTPEQLQDIEDGLRGLTKVLPATHDEIAGVAEAAGQLGVKAKDIVSFTKTMVDLGETTNLTSDEAATSIAQLMNIMQTAPEDVGRLGASLVALGNNGASTEKEVLLMAQRIAGAGAIIGLTEGEVMGFANALASVGIDVEAGGSAISRVMTDIAKQVSTNGEDLDKWASVAGMSAADFSKAFKEDPAQAIASFVEGLGEMNAAGGDVFSTLESLGQSDIRVSNALLAMSNSGDLLTDSLKLGNQAWEDNSALQTEAQKRYETTAAKIEITKNNITDAAIGFGDVFLPAIAAASEGVAGFAAFIAEVPQPLKAVFAGTGLVAGGVLLMGGSMLIAIPKTVELINSVKTLSETMPGAKGRMKDFASFMGGPWGLALMAGILAVAILDRHLKSLRSSTDEYQNAIKNASRAQDLWDVESKGVVIETLGDAVDDLGASLNRISESNGNAFMDLIEPARIDRLKTAMRSLGEQLATTAATDLPSAQKSFALLTKETDGSEKQLRILLNSMPAYKQALIDQATQQGINVTTDNESVNMKRLLELATGDSARATSTATEEYVAEADAAAELQAELDNLIDSINLLNGIGQDAVSTNAAYQESLQTVKDYIEEAKKGTEGYSRSVDESTAAGAANADMFRAQAETSQAALKAQYDLDLQTMSAKDATDKYTASLAAGRQELYNQILDLTGSAEAAQYLTDKVYGIPDTKAVELMAETAKANAALDVFVRNLNNIPGFKSVVIEQQIKQTGADAGQVKAAYGNNGFVLESFANGGLRENHVAQIAQAGTWRVWAEDETGGEAYIPLSPSKRGRSTEILDNVASRFGYQLVPTAVQSFADGSPGGFGRRASAPVERTMTGKLYLDSGEFLGTVRGLVREAFDEEESTLNAGYGGN